MHLIRKRLTGPFFILSSIVRLLTMDYFVVLLVLYSGLPSKVYQLTSEICTERCSIVEIILVAFTSALTRISFHFS